MFGTEVEQYNNTTTITPPIERHIPMYQHVDWIDITNEKDVVVHYSNGEEVHTGNLTNAFEEFRRTNEFTHIK